MTAHYDVSIVIPTLDEEDEELAASLATIHSWRRKPREVVVADGAHSQRTRELCARHEATWLASVPGRSVQLMKGAGYCHGTVLWFLRPGDRPAAESIDVIVESIDSGAAGGCFRLRFGGRRSAWKTLLELAIRIRSRWGVPYGDQGLYAARESFDVCGGFAPTPLFEEVPLVKELRRQGRFDRLALPIIVSERPWRRDGWLRRIARTRFLALAYALGVSPARLARLATPRRGRERIPRAGTPAS